MKKKDYGFLPSDVQYVKPKKNDFHEKSCETNNYINEILNNKEIASTNLIPFAKA